MLELIDVVMKTEDDGSKQLVFGEDESSLYTQSNLPVMAILGLDRRNSVASSSSSFCSDGS